MEPRVNSQVTRPLSHMLTKIKSDIEKKILNVPQNNSSNDEANEPAPNLLFNTSDLGLQYLMKL